MRALDRKLLRDVTAMAAQVVAIVLVVACGIATYVSMLSVHASLKQSRDAYFEHSRFADVFAHLSRAPAPVAERIRHVAGVATVDVRVTEMVTIDVPGLTEPATGYMVSLPRHGRPLLNDLHVRRGRWVEPGRSDEVLVSEGFASANQLDPGDTVAAVIGGRLQRLRVVGIALSPEYVYQIAPGGLWPDDKRFGVLWMEENALAAAFDMDGAFNDVSVTLAAGAVQGEVIEHLDAILEPYGSVGSYARDRQTSARFLAEELEQLEGIGAVVPTLFLAVAAFLLNIVISRMVGTQREQIAALKALGYSNLRVGIHYLELVLLVVFSGAALGAAAGGWLGNQMMVIYGEFFRLPVLDFRLDIRVLAEAALLSAGAGIVGAYSSVRRVVRLPPAEAMRPPIPPHYGRGLFDRAGIGSLMSQTGRIVVRNVQRNLLRTLLSTLGIALALAILIAGAFSQDAIDYVMEVSFERVQHQDVTVSFSRPLSRRALFELARVDGVVFVEPARNVAVRLRRGHRAYETALQGRPHDGRLKGLVDMDLQPVALPADGIVLTRALGDRLAVVPGDLVDVQVLEQERRRKTVTVAGLVDEMLGMNAYMDIDALNRLLAEGPRISGAELLLDPARRDEAYHEIKRLPHVAGASLRTAAYDIFDETTARLQWVTVLILVTFATIVAVGVVYNGARVVLSERSRELASLRVIGFTRGEISRILLGELAIQLIAALPIGCGLGWIMAAGVIANIDNELYRFPLLISPRTYAFAILVVVTAGVIAALLVRRKLDRLDLIAVLKTKE